MIKAHEYVDGKCKYCDCSKEDVEAATEAIKAAQILVSMRKPRIGGSPKNTRRNRRRVLRRKNTRRNHK